MSFSIRSLCLFNAARLAQARSCTYELPLANRLIVTQQRLPQRRAISHTSSRTAQPAASSTASQIPPAPTKPPSKPAKAAADPVQLQEEDPTHVDWTKSFHGLSVQPFAKEAADILLAPLDPGDVEIKPDGIIYLPEIKYRRILNRAFGPGGWGLAPRGEAIVTDKAVTREYALVAHGR